MFIYKSNLHEGVIGIIASRIKEYFNKPCVVLTNSNNVIKGSARSTSNFNIGEYIQKSINLNITLGGGGHNLAAGIVLKKNAHIFLDQKKSKHLITKNNFFIKVIN